MSVSTGDVLIIKVAGTQIGGLLSNSFNVAADMIEITTKDSGGAKEYTPGEYGWGMSAESLFDNADSEGFSEAVGYVTGGTSLDLYWGDTTAAAAYWAGSGYASSVEISGPKNEAASYSLDIQGTGTISEGAATA